MERKIKTNTPPFACNLKQQNQTWTWTQTIGPFWSALNSST